MNRILKSIVIPLVLGITGSPSMADDLYVSAYTGSTSPATSSYTMDALAYGGPDRIDNLNLLSNGTSLIGGAIGVKKQNFRTEIEVSGMARSHDTNTRIHIMDWQGRIKQRQTRIMMNGFYELGNSSRFTPYVGAGIGLAHSSIRLGGLTGRKVPAASTVLSYRSNTVDLSSLNVVLPDSQKTSITLSPAGQVMAGVRFRMTDHIDIFGQITHFRTISASTIAGATTFHGDREVTDARVGLVWNF